MTWLVEDLTMDLPRRNLTRNVRYSLNRIRIYRDVVVQPYIQLWNEGFYEICLWRCSTDDSTRIVEEERYILHPSKVHIYRI